MVKEDYTCTSLLSGWSKPDEHCTKRVRHCQECPEQAFYIYRVTGRTPLHEACLRNACIHVIRALLAAHPSSALQRDYHGNTPLHLLFIPHTRMSLTPEEMEEIVDELLSAVDPGELAIFANVEGNTALHNACAASESSLSPAVVTKLITANPECASHLNTVFQTPLSIYCKQPQARTSVAIAQILLEADPEAASKMDLSGSTPLHHAASKGNTDLILLLLDQAPRSALIRSGPFRATALHVLCQQNPRERHLPAVQALLRAAPETVTMAENQSTFSPLHIVCKSRRPNLDVIRLLVETDSGVASMTDAEGYTALHHACENEADVEIIRYLLNAHKRASHVVSRKQDTALHIACGANSSSKTVRLLVEANPEALTMTNDYGFTPLHCVCRAYLPEAAIVRVLIEACPECITIRTHGGETPVHLACSSGAYVGVLRLLTGSQSSETGEILATGKMFADRAMTNKIGNTPLHEACFRNAGFEQIETLAKANPEWIVIPNNAGYTPLQILCRGGRLDERVVTAFSRIRGPEVFKVVDQTGHTLLHSASRDGTDVAAIQSLIRAYPDALYLKTAYGDTPLHLACLRRAHVDVVRLIAESCSNRRISPVLEPNSAGQSPIVIAMEAFQSACRGRAGCCVALNPLRVEQVHVFEVLAVLVKLLFYGSTHQEDSCEPTNLVRACVSLHRQDVRLDPAFIRRAIQLHPEEVRMKDDEGNYPLHIEASIPVEKMSLLDSTIKGCCDGNCHTRIGILEILLEAYPQALQEQNSYAQFPLGLMVQNGRTWSHAFALAIRNFPPALHWYHQGIDDRLMPQILAKVSKECGSDSLFQLILSRPSVVRRRQSDPSE